MSSPAPAHIDCASLSEAIWPLYGARGLVKVEKDVLQKKGVLKYKASVSRAWEEEGRETKHQDSLLMDAPPMSPPSNYLKPNTVYTLEELGL